MSDELDDVFAAIRAFLERHYPGEELAEVRVWLHGGRRLALPAPKEAPAASRPRRREARFSNDFRSVDWYGERILLTEAQAQVIELLWHAQQRGTPELSQAHLLEEVESETGRIRDLFRGSRAWGRVIVPGSKKGAYRLGDPPPGEI